MISTDYGDTIFSYIRELVKRLFGLLCIKEGSENIAIVPNIMSCSAYLRLHITEDGKIRDDSGIDIGCLTTSHIKEYLVNKLYSKIPEWSKYIYEFQKSFTEIEDLYFGSSRSLIVNIWENDSGDLILPCQRFSINNGKLTIKVYHASNLCYVYCHSIEVEKEPYILDINLMDNIAGQILFDLLYTHNGAELIL